MPVIALLIGLMLSVLACSVVHDWEESKILKEITFRSESQLMSFQETIDAAFNAVLNVRSVVHNELSLKQSDALDAEEFATIVRNFAYFKESKGLGTVA